jgi:hypothetical protein
MAVIALGAIVPFAVMVVFFEFAPDTPATRVAIRVLHFIISPVWLLDW